LAISVPHNSADLRSDAMIKPEIFISYAREHEELVRELAGLLKVGNPNVFVDREGVQPGDEWEAVIVSNLTDASTIVVIWCYVASTYGARSGLIGTKFGTAEGGFLLKQLVQVMRSSMHSRDARRTARREARRWGGVVHQGKCVSLNAAGEFILGVGDQAVPLFLLSNSDDYDVTNDGVPPRSPIRQRIVARRR